MFNIYQCCVLQPFRAPAHASSPPSLRDCLSVRVWLGDGCLLLLSLLLLLVHFCMFHRPFDQSMKSIRLASFPNPAFCSFHRVGCGVRFHCNSPHRSTAQRCAVAGFCVFHYSILCWSFPPCCCVGREKIYHNVGPVATTLQAATKCSLRFLKRQKKLSKMQLAKSRPKPMEWPNCCNLGCM